MEIFFKSFGILFLLLVMSCGREDPSGTYGGEIRDWVYEYFQGTIMYKGKTGSITLILRQTPDGLHAVMNFAHPEVEANSIERIGKWELGEGRRVIRFYDGREPSEFYLARRGVRFAFQNNEGLLQNDDGSVVLLMRNEGLSRKTSYPVRFVFEDGQRVLVERGSSLEVLDGEWRWAGNKIVLSVQMVEQKSLDQSMDAETYKFFLMWDKEGSGNLLLEKMVVMRPFFKKDGTKRHKTMSSISFPEMTKFSLVSH